MVGGVLPGWSLVLLLFLLCVDGLRALGGEQLAFGALALLGSGSLSSCCMDGEAMASAVQCVRAGARRILVLFAGLGALLKLLRPALVARGGVVVSACSVLVWPCFFVLRPAVVARGEGMSKAWFGSVGAMSGLSPAQGSLLDGGRSGAGRLFAASAARSCGVSTVAVCSFIVSDSGARRRMAIAFSGVEVLRFSGDAGWLVQWWFSPAVVLVFLLRQSVRGFAYVRVPVCSSI